MEKKTQQHYSYRDKMMGVIPQDGFMRLEQVLSVLPVSKTSWWKGIKDGIYPAGVRLSARTTAWTAASIRKVVAELGGEA